MFEFVAGIVTASTYLIGGLGIVKQVIDFAVQTVVSVRSECARPAMLAVGTLATAAIPASPELIALFVHAIDTCVRSLLAPPLNEEALSALFHVMSSMIVLRGAQTISSEALKYTISTLPSVLTTQVSI